MDSVNSAGAEGSAARSLPRAVLMTLFLGLSFAGLGCLLIENDVNYPAWRTLAPRDLMRHHAAIEVGLQRTMFTLMSLHLLIGSCLLIWPFEPLGRRPVAWVLAAFLLVLVVSFAVQVPLHQAIARTGSQQAVETLIASHRQLRWPAEALALLATFAATFGAVRANQ